MSKFIIFLIATLSIVQSLYAVEKLKLSDISPNYKFEIKGKIILPRGQKLNKGAPSNITVYEKIDGQWHETSNLQLNDIFTMSEVFPYSFSVRTKKDNTQIKLNATLFHCDKVKSSYCVIDDYTGEFNRTKKTPNINLSLDLVGSSPR